MKIVLKVVFHFLLLSSFLNAQKLEIINLYDAFGESEIGTQKDFGLSMLIKYNEKTILFDSGTNADILEKNANALNVDLKKVDFAIASHAHADHTGGFHYLMRVNPKVKIYFPNDFFGASAPLTFDISGKEPDVIKKLPKDQLYFGGEKKKAFLKSNGVHYKAIEYIENHKEIIPGINLIITQSPYMGYFTKYPGIDLHGNPVSDTSAGTNFIGLPEISMSISTKKGEVLFVGCSHSTVEVIVKETKEVLGKDIFLLTGGYHLLPYDRETIGKISSRLKIDLKVKKVAPAHCTGHLAFQILKEEFGNDYQFFGLGSILKY